MDSRDVMTVTATTGGSRKGALWLQEYLPILSYRLRGFRLKVKLGSRDE